MKRRVRTVVNKREMENIIDEYSILGYEIKERGNRFCMVQKNSYGGALGHIVVFILTVGLTFGLGNLLYGIFAYYHYSKQIYLKLRDGDDGSDK